MVLIRQHCQRSIYSHSRRPFRTVQRHGKDGRLHFLVGIPEGFLKPSALLGRIGLDLLVGYLQVSKLDQITVKPLPIGLPSGIDLLQLFIVDHLTLYSVHQKHFPRMQALLHQDLSRIDIKNPNLGGEDQRIIVRDVIPGRTKPVPVENRSHTVAVAEQNRCRSVPRLHHGRIILVEILLLLGHLLRIGPWLRDCDHHRKRQLHSAHNHELDGIVKHRRIRTGAVDGRQHLVKLTLEMLRLHILLPCTHLIRVAPDGIDLSVMYDKTIRMGAFPAWIGVGTEPGMHQRDCRLIILILQICEK